MFYLYIEFLHKKRLYLLLFENKKVILILSSLIVINQIKMECKIIMIRFFNISIYLIYYSTFFSLLG